MEETLVIIKPDAFDRGISSAILERLISKFELIRMRVVQLTATQAKEHYDYLKDSRLLNEMVSFMVSRPVYIMIFKGEDIITKMQIEVGLIRGNFGVQEYKNLIHASDNREFAYNEICNLFGELLIITRHWECGCCGAVGNVICCNNKPLTCHGCGQKICPRCGGYLSSDKCARKCGFVNNETECAGTCMRCDWKTCDPLA